MPYALDDVIDSAKEEARAALRGFQQEALRSKDTRRSLTYEDGYAKGFEAAMNLIFKRLEG